MLNKLRDDVATLSRHIFTGISSQIGKARLWIGLYILPHDVSNFVILILSKMAADIQKMDKEKIDKITSIKVDFEFRD